MNYSEWRRAGGKFYLAKPIRGLAAVLRKYGYTVGTIGNGAHLKARIPEDHTPYSATGWPKACPYPWVHALDIMPPSKGSGLPSLAELGAQMVKDRQAQYPGIMWLKYLNWTDKEGRCVHETWMPAHRIRSSDDTGHIHVSARTDHTQVAVIYDPVARVRGTIPARPAPAKRTPASTAPPFPGRVIRVAHPLMRGNDVLAWQRRMRAVGYKLEQDGVFGPRSESVLKQFQRAHKITVDGKLGPVSWRRAWS